MADAAREALTEIAAWFRHETSIVPGHPDEQAYIAGVAYGLQKAGDILAEQIGVGGPDWRALDSRRAD